MNSIFLKISAIFGGIATLIIYFNTGYLFYLNKYIDSIVYREKLKVFDFMALLFVIAILGIVICLILHYFEYRKYLKYSLEE